MAQQLLNSPVYDPVAAVAMARSFVGCKWRHRGRTRFGIDCVGLVAAAVEAGGIPFEDRQDYGREPFEYGLERALTERFGEPVKDRKAGDVVMMRWESRPEAGHVGILDEREGQLWLIHSHSMSSVIAHRIDEHWENLILEVFRP